MPLRQPCKVHLCGEALKQEEGGRKAERDKGEGERRRTREIIRRGALSREISGRTRRAGRPGGP
eukprot:6056346-Pyramimonas_sp.AAC.1